MLPPAPKLQSQKNQKELVLVAADELNFTPEISDLAQQAYAAYLEKTT
jgi:hypothetical protein